MYKVFFNNKFILLTNSFEFEKISDGVLYFKYDDFEELHYIMHVLEESPNLSGVIIYFNDLPLLWADFRAHFREIDAAGGLVVNPEEKLLFIHRNGKWDLPKGKIEEDEGIETAATREVKEECGIEDLNLTRHLLNTYHTYYIAGYRILKCTYWYLMRSDQKNFTPQTEEGIDKVLWLDRNHLDGLSDETFPSIKSVIEAYSNGLL